MTTTGLAIAVVLLLVLYVSDMLTASRNIKGFLLERQELLVKNEELARLLNYRDKHIENITRRVRESLIGARVIARSNEDVPLGIGTLVGFQEVSQANNKLPVVLFESDSKEYLCLGAVIPYNEKILAEIKDLKPKEQWERLKLIGLRWE